MNKERVSWSPTTGVGKSISSIVNLAVIKGITFPNNFACEKYHNLSHNRFLPFAV